MDSPSNNLDDLVRDPKFDILTNHSRIEEDDLSTHDFTDTANIDSPYFQSKFSTTYYDLENFTKFFGNNKICSMFSLNFQSLPAKFEAINDLITDLLNKNCSPDIISL